MPKVTFLSKRNVRFFLVAFIAIFIGFVSYLLFSAVQVHSHLKRVESAVRQFTSSDQQLTSKDAAELLNSLSNEISAAHQWSTGPLWWASSQIPYLGRTPNAVRAVVTNLDRLTTSTSALEIKLASDHSNSIFQNYNFVPLLSETLAKLRTPIVAGANELSALQLSGVPNQIANPVRRITSAYTSLIPLSADADQISGIVPTLLGLDKPSKWMLVFQNGAEARSIGGFPGGWGILTASSGRLSLSSLQKQTELMNRLLVNYGDYVSPEQASLYGSDLSRMSDLNLSPDFPTNARLMAALEDLNLGVKVDGVITMNEKALANLMKATGSVTVDGKEISADSVAEYVTKGIYQDYPDPDVKDSIAFSIIKETFTKFQLGAVSPVQMVRVLVSAIYSQNLRVWAKDEALQDRIMQTSISGSMANVNNPTTAVVFVNGAGNKIDAYVHANIAYNQGACQPDFPYRDATMRISLQNTAPKSGLPSYVSPKYGLWGSRNIKSGGTKMIVYVHVPLGSIYESAKIGTNAARLIVEGADMGRSVFRFDVDLPAQSTQNLTVNFSEPVLDEAIKPSIWKQTMVNPVTTKVVTGPRCD